MSSLVCMQAGSVQATLGNYGVNWRDVVRFSVGISIVLSAYMDKQRTAFLLLHWALYAVGKLHQHKIASQISVASVHSIQCLIISTLKFSGLLGLLCVLLPAMAFHFGREQHQYNLKVCIWCNMMT